MEIEYVSHNIELPDDILTLLLSPFNEKLILAKAADLAKNIEVPLSQEIAGRLYMFAKLKGCASNIGDYLDALSHRLNNEVILFLDRNKEFLDPVLKKNEYKNYTSFDYISASKMCGSYLLSPDFGDSPEESPQFLYLRVAAQLFFTHSVGKVIEKYLEMSDWFYTHASPTLFNAGTRDAQMSSCFLLELGDDLESILSLGIKDAGIISKHMGGIGLGANRVRHSEIGFVGMSNGVMPYIKTADQSLLGANQGGKRPGAGTVFLRDWHIDVLDLIESCSSLAPASTRIDNYTGCVWMSNLFYKRLSSDGMWTMFCPANAKELNGLYSEDFEKKYVEYEMIAVERKKIYTSMKEKYAFLKDQYEKTKDELIRREYNSFKRRKVEYRKNFLINFKQLPASEVMRTITTTQLKKSVYLMNGDAVNLKSNMANIGVCNSSNLCLEITEPSNDREIASCNLASINLSKFTLEKIDYHYHNITEERSEEELHALLRGVYDFEDLGKKTRSVVENLNQVIDYNKYPLDKFDESGNVIRGRISTPNFKNRPIGIGVSGLNDAFLNLDLCYSSYPAEVLNKMIFAAMYFNALAESLLLSVTHPDGHYSTFRTGECKIYDESSSTFKTIKGSPLSNGLFQFDLCRKYARYLKDTGDLVEHEESVDEFGNITGREIIYNTEDDTPLDPKSWGQLPIRIKGRNRSGETVDEILQPDWESLRQLIVKYGVRNSMLLALMPTASTAEILRNTETTEAHQQLIYSRKAKDGNFMVVVRQFRDDMMELGLWNDNVVNFIMGFSGSIQKLHLLIENYPHLVPNFNGDWERVKYLQEKHKTMFEISQRVVIRHARQRAIYVDQSQSMNIYLSGEKASPEILQRVHLLTYWMGLKTQIYYLRQLPGREASKLVLPSSIRAIVEALDDSDSDTDSPPPLEEIEDGPELDDGPVCTREEGCLMCSA